MSDEFKETIERLEAVLRRQLQDAAVTRQMINNVCRLKGEAERYAEATPEQGTVHNIRADQFHGRKLATVITEYMTARRSANLSPASVNEIYDALIAGGYVFDTKNEENSKRSLRSSLSKNPKFYKLPGGEYGLREWYPDAKKKDSGEDEEVEEE